ncbi:hypothetical protein ACFY64_26405 [Streptomyces collinus]
MAPLLGGRRWVVVHTRPDTHCLDSAAASALIETLRSWLARLWFALRRV